MLVRGAAREAVGDRDEDVARFEAVGIAADRLELVAGSPRPRRRHRVLRGVDLDLERA
jgi:hypothetical protein